MKRKYDIGQKLNTKNNGELVIASHKKNGMYEVVFLDTSYKTLCFCSNITLGNVKDFLKPSVCGVGVIGDGIHKTTVNNKKTKVYICWKSMIQRCYDNSKDRNSTYADCEVCEEWQEFQIFAEWYFENYPRDGSDYQLDKDTIKKGNKIYSPETCCFISKEENIRHANAKEYILTSPDGAEVKVYSLNRFCKENDLNNGMMVQV